MIKKTKRLIGQTIIFILVVVVIIGVFVFNALKIPTPMKDFCQEKGYESMTDYSYYVPIRGYDLQIECDGEKIFMVFNVCDGLDKWGECKGMKYSERG